MDIISNLIASSSGIIYSDYSLLPILSLVVAAAAALGERTTTFGAIFMGLTLWAMLFFFVYAGLYSMSMELDMIAKFADD